MTFLYGDGTDAHFMDAESYQQLAVPLSGWLYSSSTGVQVVYLGLVPLPDVVPKDRELARALLGFLPGLKAFTAAVFGGIGNLAGAVVGGILLGLIESIGSGYIGIVTGGVLGSNYSDIFAFIVLIIMLTLRPSGLLGERVADRA